MEAEPNYGLVTAFRNERNWLADLVRSIEAQHIKPAMWVLVDDGSTDDSLDHVRSLTRHLPFVEIVAVVDAGTRNFASQVYAQLAGVERLAATMTWQTGKPIRETSDSSPIQGSVSRAGICSTGSEDHSSTQGAEATTTTFPEEYSYSEPSATGKLEGICPSRVGGRTS